MVEKVSIADQLSDHGHRIELLEHNMSDFTQSLKRVDDSNRYLRKQNDKILDAVVEQKNVAEQHDYDLKRATKTNHLKMFGMFFGASGLAVAVIELVIKLM